MLVAATVASVLVAAAVADAGVAAVAIAVVSSVVVGLASTGAYSVCLHLFWIHSWCFVYITALWMSSGFAIMVPATALIIQTQVPAA